MTFSVLELRRALTAIEDDFLRSDERDVSDIIKRLHALQVLSPKACKAEQTNEGTIIAILQSAQRIQLVAKARMNLEETFASLRAEMVQDTRRALQKESQPSDDLSETLPAYHMRKHFLATLDDPYPSQDEKEALVRIINESVGCTDTAPSGRDYFQPNQLTLWFINARRRSGWSSILRKFARNDRNRMKLLMQTKLLCSNFPIRNDPLPSALTHKVVDLLRDNLGRLTPDDEKEFEDLWASMISWIKYGVKEKVGDWVYDLVAASKKASKPGQGRAVTTAASRSPARKPAKAQAKPKKAKQRSSKTPSLESSAATTSGLGSTPELSMCSTADTFFSSLNCNLSMLHYDPFQHEDELLQSPSLRPKGGRKVKALPRRAQKMSSDSLYTSKFFPFLSLSLLGYRN